jgi:hypothetical protein
MVRNVVFTLPDAVLVCVSRLSQPEAVVQGWMDRTNKRVVGQRLGRITRSRIARIGVSQP